MQVTNIVRSTLKGLLVGASVAMLSVAAMAEDVIKIGDVNSYTNYPDHLGHYKNGMDIALDEINSAGGVDGKKLVVVTRDDKGARRVMPSVPPRSCSSASRSTPFPAPFCRASPWRSTISPVTTRRCSWRRCRCPTA